MKERKKEGGTEGFENTTSLKTVFPDDYMENMLFDSTK